MKVLIVGMGIGQLYKSIHENKLYDVTTGSIQDKSADYWDIEQVDGEFDIAHICTPKLDTWYYCKDYCRTL